MIHFAKCLAEVFRKTSIASASPSLPFHLPSTLPFSPYSYVTWQTYGDLMVILGSSKVTYYTGYTFDFNVNYSYLYLFKIKYMVYGISAVKTRIYIVLM